MMTIIDSDLVTQLLPQANVWIIIGQLVIIDIVCEILLLLLCGIIIIEDSIDW